MPFELEMVPGQGTLQLRDADPYSLAAPTRIAGTADDQTGALSGLTFSTPNVEIEQEITSPLHADVLIEAVFSQVAPGSGTVDPSGNITITQTMKVELHIDVIPVGNTVPMDLPGDCVAAPIDLVLASTAPYDPETERVSITAGDFTIPEILASDACNDQLTPEVNKQLQGGGHSLSLVLEGEIPMPPDGDCDTTTSLVVAPSGSSPLGEEVTFTSSTAPVASDPECGDAAAGGEALSGVVDFMRDGVVIGSDEIAGDGTGTFSTSTLPAGNQNLTARFRGNNPYIRSTSGPISYLVTVAPQVTTTLPEFITLGQAVEFTTTVSNTSFGAALDDVRLDVDIRSFTAEPRIELFDGTTWVEIPLETLLPDYVGSLPTFDLAPGAERTERMRISVGTPSQPPAAPGNATLTFEVRPGDAALDTASPHDDALGSGEARTVFISTERVAPYFSYFWGPTGAVEPHTVRQGGTIGTYGFFIEPQIHGYTAQGYVEFLVDGQVVPVARDINARPGSEFTRLPATSGSIPVVLINLPPSIAAGAHTLTFRYSGDAMFLPHQETHEFTVVTARGPSYMCLGESTNPFYFRANVVAQANVPSSAARGTTIDLDNLALAILTDRSYFTYDVYFRSYLYDDSSTQVGDGPSGTLEGVRFTVNGSAGTATGVTRSNSYPFLFMGTPYPAPEPEVDHVIALDGESGTFQLDAAIGDVVPVTLDSIELDLRNFLGTYRVSCTPVGEPAVLGQVRVAGVELAVTTEDPGAPVRVGDEVTLTADTKYPDGAGVAEFRDGTTTIGVAPLVDGTASMTTDDLPVGGRSLTVRVFPNPAASMLVSSMVPLPVLPAHDCEAFALEGSGAVVRLVFMELLGRCPDQAGFDYWTGRLDGGTSPEAFARAISATPEAVGMVVDDAYVTMLGRKADAAGKAFWVERMRTGSGRYDQLLADLAGSTEFWSQSGSSNVGFVGRVYEQLLDRAPDQAGQDFWVGRLDAGISPRALILQLANLDEPLGVLVGESYLEILGRVPVAGERGSGITFLRRTGDRSGFYAELIGTPEFADRAQDFPNPED